MVHRCLNTHGTLSVYLLCRLLTVSCFQKNRFGEIVNSGSQSNSMVRSTLNTHTCHKLWTKMCEIRQNFKRDLIKFCEIFTKITLKLPQNSQKLVINTTKCDKCLFLHKNVLKDGLKIL